jgi:BirA family biotin operon repressor/biotin-[acetyl-CoA-carboxylase] ligase
MKIYHFEKIASTNQTLWQLLEQGKIPPIAAIAAEQTAGRGQWGRQWQSQRGGLYLSLALTLDIPATDAPHLTLFSAWGIAQHLRDRNLPVWIKWPNDLILEGRKLGGIKSETRVQQGKIIQAVIGVGINWTNPVPEVGINLQSFLRDRPNPTLTSLEQLAMLTLDGLLWGYQRYQSGGIEAVLPGYLERLESLGRSLTVQGCLGSAIGVTSQGELRVRLHAPGATTEICLPPGTISLGYEQSPI